MSATEYEDIDWADCPDIERVPGRCAGDWTVIGTQILPACVTGNMDELSAEKIDGQYPGLGVDRARRIIAYARQHACFRTLRDNGVPRG